MAVDHSNYGITTEDLDKLNGNSGSLITCNSLITSKAEALSQESKRLKSDMVNHPPHYLGKIECIEAIEEATKWLNGVEAICVANVIKYLWRFKKKNGLEDVRKAQWYLEHLISKLDDKKSI